ncbi:hypothetical protein Pan161_22820 [Gimesia algae]|uniref:Uncharacterized protein n=1 Tax=Gimesia algae TaxID=2527971 RepID=A0A517VCA8_9PLAN|nr:hypothetical protein Pan161_22820 [Gimesia algae]
MKKTAFKHLTYLKLNVIRNLTLFLDPVSARRSLIPAFLTGIEHTMQFSKQLSSYRAYIRRYQK